MAIPYDKPFKSIPDQIALLTGRGMVISDVALAARCLERIGYYRLSGYSYPFRKREARQDGRGGTYLHVLDEFQDNTEFRHITELYIFDKKLRMLLLDGIERIEVALRVEIATLIGSRSKTAHREIKNVHGNFCRVVPGNPKSEHQLWVERLDKLADESKEEFAKHFKRTYDPPLPIWVSIETWDFGLLSVFLSGMKWDDLLALCAKFNFPRPPILQSWIRTLNHVRNICAHHSRLWNKALVDHPARPTFNEMPLHNHWVLNDHSATRIYSAVAAAQHFIRILHPASSWRTRLKQHIASFPNLATPHVSLLNSGFPVNWETQPLWN